jgi:MFS family permease
MASGWSLGGSVAFAIAGQISDYFGRRYIILFGQALLVLGHILGATAQSVNQCIAAMVILGFGTGEQVQLCAM